MLVIEPEPQKPEVQPGSVLSTVIVRDTDALCQ